MPSKSKAQAHLMAAVAHNPAFAKKVGIPVSVGKEFNKADKGRKFRSGDMVKKVRKFAEGDMVEDDSIEALREAGIKYGMGRKNPKLPGEDIERTYENPITKKIKDTAKDVGKYVTGFGMPGGAGAGIRRKAVESSMKKGGMAHSEKGEMKKDLSQDKKMIKKAVTMHDKQLHGGKKTSLTALKNGGRTPVKGDHPVQKKAKVGAKMIKMCGGGMSKKK